MRTFLIWTAAVGATWVTSTIAAAQQQQAQPIDPVAKKLKLNPAKEFREIAKRIDALDPKCNACKGRGEVKVKGKIVRSGCTVPATVSECHKCNGTGWVSVADTATFRSQFPRATQEIKDERIKHREL